MNSDLKIDEPLVRHVAKLAHLHLSEEEVAYYCGQLTKILTHVDKLKDLKKIAEPEDLDAVRVSTLERMDQSVDAKVIDAALRQAPQRIGSAFQVPRIIE